MLPVALGLVLAAGAAGAGVPEDALAFSPAPLRDTVEQALPPPPTVVVRKTRYYGTVTIDHRAHLARRAACRSCHGPGVVTKLELPPKVAHDRCIGCHQEEKRGPVDCKGCHVKDAAPATSPAPSDAPTVARRSIVHVAGEAHAAAAPIAGAAVGAIRAGSPPPAPGGEAAPAVPRTIDVRRASGVERAFSVGAAVGRGLGPSLRFTARHGSLAIAHSVENLSGGGESRTFGLIGAGVSRPLSRSFSGEALALGGFDAVRRPQPSFLPALGARVAIGWHPRRWSIAAVQLAVAGVADLHAPRGEVAPVTVFTSLATEFSFPGR
jgi:hypothetical protein